MKKTSKLDQEIGENIKVNRILKKRSRSWIAKKIGKSYQQVQKYETGKDRISASVLYVIAGLLKTPIANFFFENEK